MPARSATLPGTTGRLQNLTARTDAALARLSRHPGLALIAACLVALILFLPGFTTVPPVDRDEALFSQASRQMVQSGDFIDIRLGEGTRYKKPVGIYWLQSAALGLVGPDHENAIWVYRLPSLAAAIAATALTFLIGAVLAGPATGFLAALLMASTFVLGGEARLAKTDATLLATILAAQLVLARLHMRGAEAVKGAWPYLFWAALGASILVKGPVGLMVVGLTALVLVALKRELRWLSALRPLRGALLMLAIAVPWYVAITLKTGDAFWAESLGRDLLGKIGEGQESHGRPPGFYTLLVWFTFWPASLLLPFGVWLAVTGRREPAVIFCLAWILPTWIVFEIAATKLIHYVMPVYPALAILSAEGWLRRDGLRPGRGYLVFLGIFLGLALVLAAVPLGFSLYFGGAPTLVWALGVAISIAGMWTVWTSVRAGQRWTPALGIAALALGLSVSLYGQLARLDYMWPSVRMADIYAGADLCADPALISVGYTEPSLYLLTDRWPVFTGPDDAARVARAADCAVVFVDAPQRAAFEAAMAGAPMTEIGQVAGFGLGRAREIDMAVFAVGPG